MAQASYHLFQNRAPGKIQRHGKQLHAKMMLGENRIVDRMTSNPTIDGRHVYGDWAISWGHLNDDYILKDGSAFKFNSLFTATIIKRGEQWKITSFHASVNAFENPILGVMVKKVAAWSALGGGAVGLFAGALLMRLVQRRRSSPTVPG